MLHQLNNKVAKVAKTANKDNSVIHTFGDIFSVSYLLLHP